MHAGRLSEKKSPPKPVNINESRKKKPPCNWFARGLLAYCKGYAEADSRTGVATGKGS